MAVSTIDPNGLNVGQFGNRNLIVNSAMQVAQRGTSVTGQTSSAYHTVDRWETSGSGSTYNQSQQAVPLGDSTVGSFQYFLRHEVTTGNDFSGLVYKVEDVRSAPEGTVTLSFYAKGTNPGNGQLSMTARQYFGTGGSPSSDVIATTQAFTLTSNWQRFEFQITVPPLTGKTIGTNNDSFYKFQLTQPSSDDTTTAWTLDITGVQLEVGDTATPFEHISFGDQLQKCMRYFEVTAVSPEIFTTASVYTSTAAYGCWQYQVTKRTNPSVGRWQGAAGDYRFRANGNNATATALVLSNSNPYSCRADITVSGGLTGGHSGWISTFNGPSQWYADAEL